MFGVKLRHYSYRHGQDASCNSPFKVQQTTDDDSPSEQHAVSLVIPICCWSQLAVTGRRKSTLPKISNLMVQLCSKLYYASDYKLSWLMKVHSLLDSLGLSYIWSYQIHTIESFKRIVKQRLMDQFIQEWQSSVAENSVCSNYRLFKKKFCFEKYLTYLPSILRQRVLKFRLSNHRLPIQQRRSLGIPRDERICTVCDSGEGRRWISLFA